MFYRLYRIIIFAALLLLPAHPALAAPFLLPDDAVIEIRDFAFPATPDISPDRHLPASFHSQLAFALQKAGLSVHHGKTAAASKPEENGAEPPVKEGVAPQEGSDAPLIVTPLEEEKEEAAANAPIPLSEAAEPAGSPNSNGTAENEKAPRETPPASPAPSVHNRAATHILEGNVTLFREAVGAPNRIAGSIRIRAESQLHCAYTIKDAVTGKVLIADVASGSAARITGETSDYDAVLNRLSARAMATAADTIAAQLSGRDTPGDGVLSDRNYYQDSPGKRLKSQK
ncbi:exported hypothetical protein [uncultured delta proteobacterium]|uniref:Curli production assembly/transport component CsgG n=1 Tax=uncultured delta proteobacterium TaxID=34034 RepID=A0A212IU82_9DELT|nr:exported hypothetical protein [uncultured delta proteobacterium]